MILVRRYNYSICVVIKCESLALCIPVFGRCSGVGRLHFNGLKGTVRVVVVEQIALVYLGQVFFNEFETELAAILNDSLQFVLGKEPVNLGNLCHLLHDFCEFISMLHTGELALTFSVQLCVFHSRVLLLHRELI